MVFFTQQPGAHPEIMDFGSGQGRSDFETTGVGALRRGFQMSENAGLGQKMLILDGHNLISTKPPIILLKFNSKTTDGIGVSKWFEESLKRM